MYREQYGEFGYWCWGLKVKVTAKVRAILYLYVNMITKSLVLTMYGEQKQGILPFVLNHMKRNLDKVKLETKHVSAILLVIKVKV